MCTALVLITNPTAAVAPKPTLRDLDTPEPITCYWLLILHREHRLPYAALGFLRFAEQVIQEYFEPRWICNEIDALLAGLEN
ncbi:hypothetical protein GCM10007159_17210 [Modicisalibacter luteus]|nr:hypothetical protein GCM10007159_17210 [Halomonas lutea]